MKAIKNLHQKIIAQVGNLNNKSVLDYGCGHSGMLELLLKNSEPPKSIIAVDSDNEMVQECHTRFARFISEEKLSVLQISDPASLLVNNFDIIFCHNVLECVVDKELFVKNLFNLLNPGGVLVLSHHDFDSAIYNSSFVSLTRNLVHCFADTKQKWQEYCDGQMGRKIPGIFKRALIKNVTIDTWRMAETSFESGDYGFLMCDMIMGVCKDKFTQEELTLWQQDLITKAKTNDYYFAIDIVVAKAFNYVF